MPSKSVFNNGLIWMIGYSHNLKLVIIIVFIGFNPDHHIVFWSNWSSCSLSPWDVDFTAIITSHFVLIGFAFTSYRISLYLYLIEIRYSFCSIGSLAGTGMMITCICLVSIQLAIPFYKYLRGAFAKFQLTIRDWLDCSSYWFRVHLNFWIFLRTFKV